MALGKYSNAPLDKSSDAAKKDTNGWYKISKTTFANKKNETNSQ